MELKLVLTKLLFKLTPKFLVREIQKPVKKQLDEIKRTLVDRNESWSQEGEDMILARIFGNKSNGFYVDIGAHHPCRFSNTYRFYRQGWSGINVDAMPGSMEIFNKLRPRDINIECPIALEKKALKFFIFNEPALNTFSQAEAERKNGKNNYWIQEEIVLQTIPLHEVLDKYLPFNQRIDFMTIDVEGLDYEVLQSNDWDKYKPSVILIESLKNNFLLTIDHPIANLLYKKGYFLIAKTLNTYFYTLCK